MPRWYQRKPWRVVLKFFAVAAVAVAIVLFIAQDNEVLRIHAPMSADDPTFIGYAATLTGSAVSRGDRAEMLLNGDQIFPAMLDAIGRAQRRISFETYIYGTGTVADQFSRAFADAARRGVRSDQIDAIGSSDMAREHVKLRRTRVVRLARSIRRAVGLRRSELPLAPEDSRRGRDVAFTGGVGVDDKWLGHAQDKDHWRDTQFRIIGPAVREMEGAFYENAIETRPEVTAILDPAPPPVEGDTAGFVVWSSPSGGSSDIKRLYLVALAASRQRILITSPYFVTDESLMWALEQARKRSVTIRILVEGDITDAKPVKYASRFVYEKLLEMGVQIYEYQPTMVHTKTMVVDGTLAVFGTSNFDNRSLELNDEVNVAMRDRDLVTALSRTFEDDIARSKELLLEEWRRRGWLEKAREQFWRWFSEVF